MLKVILGCLRLRVFGLVEVQSTWEVRHLGFCLATVEVSISDCHHEVFVVGVVDLTLVWTRSAGSIRQRNRALAVVRSRCAESRLGCFGSRYA